MIHGDGRNIRIFCCKNVKKFSDRYIRILLKINGNIRLLTSGITALRSGPEMEVEILKALRVACC